jgi:acetyltransferase-like isoleucine patch superfamily enzyme
MNFRLFSQIASANSVLRLLGAKIGDNTHIYSDICVYNAENYNYKNLIIGSNVYIGTRCLFDLTSEINIHDNTSISAQVSFITHLDVGNQPLKGLIQSKEGPITIQQNTWVGVNTTILHNVNIGEFAMIGAMSLVNKNIPAKTVAYGIPCRVMKEISDSES